MPLISFMADNLEDDFVPDELVSLSEEELDLDVGPVSFIFVCVDANAGRGRSGSASQPKRPSSC